jgi:hypothetical protein
MGGQPPSCAGGSLVHRPRAACASPSATFASHPTNRTSVFAPAARGLKCRRHGLFATRCVREFASGSGLTWSETNRWLLGG